MSVKKINWVEDATRGGAMEGVGEGVNGPLGIATIVVGRSDTCFANVILTIHNGDGEGREKTSGF